MRDDIRCHISIDDYGHGLRFYVACGERLLRSDGSWEDYKEGSEPAEPTFQVRGPLARPVLGAVVEAIERLGVKPPERSHVEGRLEAQTRHLEDLRKLVPGLA